ncbi:galactokinase [Cellulomonas triticagri]|uniref:Galactokinase n=1 Tax=Cellulomonas triticagri TaxID=2483352 RepID=A0A3M2J961_9CELL|nr:galactokinase [Cellulomonas triticagri]RMI07018.1 galactokinase [Cellulomonas triticagri]
MEQQHEPTTAPVWVGAWEPADGAARVRALFAERFGGEPDGTWSAPGRVNLIGEHTDYNGGLCLPFDLPHRTYAAVRRTEGDVVRLVSAQEATGVREIALADVAPGTVQGWPAYVVGVAWALREAGHAVGGFDIAVDSCVPYGAGLSSSAALECAAAVAVDALFGLRLAGTAEEPDDAGRAVLAAACIRAENEIAGASTGGMDQSVSLRGRAGHALLLDCRDGSVRHVPFDLAAHDLALLVIDTKAEHALVDGQYAARRAACERAAEVLGVETLREITPDGLGDALATLAHGTGPVGEGSEDAEVLVRRVRHVVTEIARVEEFVALLDDDRVEEVGEAMDASHASLRDDYEVSCRELDVAVEAARDAGALGARMTGGGFGGSAIALVRAAEVDAVAAAVADAFAAQDLHAPAFLVAVASAPAY